MTIELLNQLDTDAKLLKLLKKDIYDTVKDMEQTTQDEINIIYKDISLNNESYCTTCNKCSIFKLPNSNELICNICGLSNNDPDNVIYDNVIKYGVHTYSNYSLVCYNSKEAYDNIKLTAIYKCLSELNKKQPLEQQLHDNILKEVSKWYIKLTDGIILRANNKNETLSCLLSKMCLLHNNPKTQTYIIKFMNLLKGGNARGQKKISEIFNNNNKDNNELEELNVLLKDLDVNQELIKLKSYTSKMIKHKSPSMFYPIVIKMYNFTNKIKCVELKKHRTDTKIIGCIGYLIKYLNSNKLLKLSTNKTFYNSNNIEQNTISKFISTIKKLKLIEYYNYIINLYKDDIINK